VVEFHLNMATPANIATSQEEGVDQPEPDSATASTSEGGNASSKITVTAPSIDQPPKEDTRSVVKRLESGGRILSLIKKAETKRVAKRKIITFLKKKGVSESKIIEAYSAYYKEEGLYEITFNQRPLGFSVIMDTRGKNAIVSSVQDDTNGQLGMKIASRVYEINGKRVDDVKHKEILQLMAQQPTPFYVVFKESGKKNSKIDKHKEKIDKGLKWREETDEIAEDEETDGAETGGAEAEVESSDSSGYDSDDFDAHVHQHYQRKQKSGAMKKKRERAGTDSTSLLFKPHEIDQWDDNLVVDEQAAMLKHMAALMMDAVSHADLKKNDAGGSGPSNLDGMTHKRANTLKAMVDMTASPEQMSAVGHRVRASMDRKASLSVGDLQSLDVDAEYDPEIFKYLSQLVMGGQERKASHVPLTPSTSRLMKDLFAEDGQGDEDISLNLPDSFHAVGNSSSGGGFPNANFGGGGGGHGVQYSGSMSEISHLEDTKVDDDEDVIESLEQGTTLLKYGKYGKPKFKMFHLSKDHKYLVWYSQKKNSEETRIRIKEIRKIAIGSDSKVVEKTKKADVHETSFTIFYGKANNEKHWKSLTVTAKNEKEAFVWAQGLKILSDASKQGRHIRTLSKNVLSNQNEKEDQSVDSSDPLGRRKHFAKTQSVIISMDKLQSKSVMNLFSKSSAATATSLLKQQSKHKQQLQKCVDFVMTKANYRAIAAAGQFDKVKLKLEDLDNRLRETKTKLTTNDMADLDSDLSAVKAELYSCAADLDALKQKLTAIVRRPQKL